MAFSWWFWGKKEGSAVTDESSSHSHDWGFGFRQPESLKFPGVKKKKWQERRVDREHHDDDDDDDTVVVPSDGVCLSGSESEDSTDWSIGWLEPHGADFLSDDETDDSFAVLVPCYNRNDPKAKGLLLQHPNNHRLFPTLNNLTDDHFFTDGKDFMEKWFTSLQSITKCRAGDTTLNPR